MKKKQVTVIGAGASGMMAAIFAAEAGAEVTLLEHKDRVGKKILSTGNGKCNLSNRRMEADCYRCSVPSFPMEVIGRFPVERTLEFFEDLGIVFKDRDGYLYPASGQASAVLDVLRMKIASLLVHVVTECQVKEIRVLPEEKGFVTVTDKGSFSSVSLILSCGSKAAPVTGSDGSGYLLAKKLGHHIIKPLPALVQLRCKEAFFRQISGVRLDGRVSLRSGGKVLGEDTGEIQLTDYGISGIPVFQVSRYAARALDQGKPVEAVLDFCPSLSRKQVRERLEHRRDLEGDRKAEDFLTGWFHKKAAALFLKLSHIRPEQMVHTLGEKEIAALTDCICSFTVQVTGVNPFEQAQICCGGADVREVSSRTMESRKVQGLYLTGELLDVDGICGGYNLQWAWSSGAIAGMHAGGKE